MLRTINCGMLAIVMTGCASGPSAGSGGQQIIADTMEQVCLPAAMKKSSPLVDFMVSRVSKQYVPSGPLQWRAPSLLTEMQVAPDGCLLTYFGGSHNEIRADQLARAARDGFKVLYTGPNATGGTIRDVLCTDRPDGSSAGIIMSTSKTGPDGRIPMVMISTTHQADNCAALAEKSVIAIPRQAAPANQ